MFWKLESEISLTK